MIDGLAVLDQLRDVASRDGMRKTAKLLGVSHTTLSLILHGKYPANNKGVLDRAERLLQNEPVDCPALGAISVIDCLQWQARARQPLAATSSHAAKVCRACRACARFTGGGNG